MTFLVTALKAEARPLIDFYALKKQIDTNYQIYSNADVILIISGIGKINAAIAAAYLLTHFKAKKSDKVLNIGICGCFDKSIDIGSLFLVQKIIDQNSSTVIHTTAKADILPSSTITCHDKPLGSSAIKTKSKLADMESFGFYQAAKKFIAKEHIYLIKAVSDHICDTIPSSEFVYKLINKEMGRIDQLIQ